MDVDLAAYVGISQFGTAYQVMLENDAHAVGSVDRVLMANMVRLCAATAQYIYGEYTQPQVRYIPGSRPALEEVLRDVLTPEAQAEERVVAISDYCSRLAEEAPSDPGGLVLGGTEEEIILRGSDWCTDLARVGCVLCQVAGLPARIVYLADTSQAYSGHAIIEAYRDGVWGAADVTSGVVYRSREGKPVSTWELMCEPWLIGHHASSGVLFSPLGEFRRAGVVNYSVADAHLYDYSMSMPNAYYRSILAMFRAGWPGGLRWLHGEDGEPCPSVAPSPEVAAPVAR